MDKNIRVFKEKFESLTSNYVYRYRGNQPIMSIIDNRIVKIEQEFLAHLPFEIKKLVENVINSFNQFDSNI